VEALEKQTSAFIEQCLDPKDNAADVMAKLRNSEAAGEIRSGRSCPQ
jgi:hypothetical protein